MTYKNSTEEASRQCTRYNIIKTPKKNINKNNPTIVLPIIGPRNFKILFLFAYFDFDKIQLNLPRPYSSAFLGYYTEPSMRRRSKLAFRVNSPLRLNFFNTTISQLYICRVMNIRRFQFLCHRALRKIPMPYPAPRSSRTLLKMS